MMKKLIALVLAVLLAAALVPSLAEVQYDELLATVNGTPVCLKDTMYYNNYYINYYVQKGYSASDPNLLLNARYFGLRSAVEVTVELQNAEKLGYTLTDEEKAELIAQADDTYAQVGERYAMTYFGLTADTEEAERETILDLVHETMCTTFVNGELLQRLTAGLSADIDVSDADVAAYFASMVAADEAQYRGNVAAYEYNEYYGGTSLYIPEGYRGVTQILLAVDSELLQRHKTLSAALGTAAAEGEEPVTQEQVDAAEQAILESVAETVSEIKARLEKGESFESIIPDFNTDPGMQQPENLKNGYKVHAESIIYDPAFVKAAFSVDEIGQLAEPAVGSYGVYLVYYHRDWPCGAAELTEEMAASIRSQLQASAEDENLILWLEQWKEEAEIVYTDAGSSILSAVGQ